MPKGTSPVAGEKPKPKRRRAVKSVSAPILAPITTQARFISVEKQVPMKKKKTSWLFAGLQILFAIAVIVGAYFLFHQVQKISEEARKREAALQEQLQVQVGVVQEKFDTLIDTWQKQQADEEQANRRVEYSIAQTTLTGSHIAYLGNLGMDQGKYVFSANPDIWGEIGVSIDTCKAPLSVDENGYCDVIESVALKAIERVVVERNEDGEIIRLVKQVTVPVSEDTAFRWSVDLGTPVIKDRDVFAPVDADAQKEAVSAYVRTILKHEDLPEVLAENLNAFDDLIEHLRLGS